MHHHPTGTVTLLLSEIEGSTLLLQHVGERYTDVLAECRHLLRTAFQPCHGHEVDTQGESFFVAFARASDAVSAAVEAQRVLAAHAWPQGVNVRVRMGLHTGEPQAGAEGYMGLDVHRAARIMSAGHGGQVLLSQTARDLVEHDLPDGVSLRDLGAHRLKDLEHSHHLYQLVIVGLPADFPPLGTLDTHTHNLPVQLTPLIGRQREVAAVGHLLQREDVRLLTLTGTGGTGKTRLGLQAVAELMEEFSDGVFFVNLAPISDPELVVPTIAQALGIKEGAGQLLLDLVSASLQEKQLLVLLDNFEQVSGAAIEVATLLARCPRLKVLVTSRAALHVRGEQEFAVPPLAIPDPKHLPDLVTLSQYEAVALFIARAQAVKPDFHVTNATAPAVAEICVRLDGLPLAIELAAARSKLLPLPALLSRLEHRLQVLTSGAQDAPRRQQTLRNTIAWSYDLLSAEEQQLFRYLAVFVDGCTWQAAEAVYRAAGAREGDILEGLAALVDKSLLRQEEQAGGEVRLRMLQVLREFGLQALADAEESEVTSEAHAVYYLRLAEQGGPALKGAEQVRWLHQLEQEQENLRVALTWLLERADRQPGGEQAELALRLGEALVPFWESRRYVREGQRFLEQALATSAGVEAPVRARALLAAAYVAFFLDDMERCEPLCEQGLALFLEAGDTAGEADALLLLGSIDFERCAYATGRIRLEQATALFQELGDSRGRAGCLAELARLFKAQGDYARARLLLEESLALFRTLGDRGRTSQVLLWLAAVCFLAQDDLALAVTLTEQGLALARELGDVGKIAHTLMFQGECLLAQGQTAQARTVLEEDAALYKEILARTRHAEYVAALGETMHLLGDLEQARALYLESLAHYCEGGVTRDGILRMWQLAAVLAGQGEPERAVRLWGAVEAWREATGTPLEPVYRSAYEQAVAAARAQLGEQAFTVAWAQGRAMTPEQVLASLEPAYRPEPVFSASPPKAAVKSSPPLPDGLTAREVEVLRLVAQGLSNAEIAEQLIISLLTVKAHMRSLYNKLGISSRSAATRYAIEQHLM